MATEQEEIFQRWRRLTEQEVPVEIRIEVEDLLRNPYGRTEPSVLLYDRIQRLSDYAQRKAASNIPSKRDSLVLVFRLLAMLVNLLREEGFGQKVQELTEKLTLTTKREVPGHLEHISGEEFDSFFCKLTDFESDIKPQERSTKISVVTPAIVVASSRGALAADAEALLFFKDEHVPLELLVEQMTLLRKARAEEYTLVTEYSYKSTMNALGYAIVKKYVRFPDNWAEVVQRLGADLAGCLRPIPISVKHALRQSGPNDWPEDPRVFAKDLTELLGHLYRYADMVAIPGDEWGQLAEIVKQTNVGFEQFITNNEKCHSCGGTGGDDEDCCNFCGGSGKQKDFHVPTEG